MTPYVRIGGLVDRAKRDRERPMFVATYPAQVGAPDADFISALSKLGSESVMFPGDDYTIEVLTPRRARSRFRRHH